MADRSDATHCEHGVTLESPDCLVCTDRRNNPNAGEDEGEVLTMTIRSRCTKCYSGSTGEPGESCSQCGRPMEPMFEGA